MKIRDLTLILLYSLFIFNFSFALDSQCKQSDYKKILEQQESSFIVKKIEFNESTEGGEAQCFFKNGNLKIIKLEVYGEMGKRFINYYIHKDKKSYLVSSQDFYYNSPIYDRSSKIIKMRKYKFIVCNKNKIINLSKEKYEKRELDYIKKMYNQIANKYLK